MTQRPQPISSAPPTRNLLLLILLFGIAIRCVNITQPFTDTWSWRQGDVAMIAENFLHNGFHLFYPEVNWGGPPHGDARGYVGTELPIMPWLAAILYQFTGIHEWVGRSLSVLSWAISLPALFLYVKRLVNERTALFACLFYALIPLCIYTSRSFMPDMPSLCAALWTLVFFDYWLDNRKSVPLIAATIIALALALLIKPPSIMIGFAMLVRGLQKHGIKIFVDPRLWIIAITPMVPTVLWFRHAKWLGTTFFPHHLFGEEGFRLESPAFYMERLGDMTFHGMTIVVVAAAIVGMVLAMRDRRFWPLYAWFAGWAVFFVIAGHGNRHQWYQLPLAPVLAIFASVLVVWLYVHIRSAHLVLAFTSCISFYAATAICAVFPPVGGGLYVYGQDSSLPAMLAGQAVDRLTPKDAEVLAANIGDPVVLYYSHRYGYLFPHGKDSGLWNGMPDSYNGKSPTDWVTNSALINEIEQRRREGAQFFIITRDDSWWLTFYTQLADHMRQYPIIEHTDMYTLIDLRK